MNLKESGAFVGFTQYGYNDLIKMPLDDLWNLCLEAEARSCKETRSLYELFYLRQRTIAR
jgi:hypothetical protein